VHLPDPGPSALVADLDDTHPLVAQEHLGPALPIVKYTDVEGAISMANGPGVGPGASVWTADPARAREVAARVHAGTLWIDEHGNAGPRIPFGGARRSGYGPEGGVEGRKHLGIPPGRPRLTRRPARTRVAPVACVRGGPPASRSSSVLTPSAPGLCAQGASPGSRERARRCEGVVP
jgi:hypothetical protein